MLLNIIEKVENMKRLVLGYVLSAASVYLTMSFLTRVFLNLINNFALPVL